MVGLVVPNEALATVRLVPEKRGGVPGMEAKGGC